MDFYALRTALWEAVNNRDFEAVEQCLAAPNADLRAIAMPIAVGFSSSTDETQCCVDRVDSEMLSPIHLAIRNVDFLMVQRLLREARHFDVAHPEWLVECYRPIGQESEHFALLRNVQRDILNALIRAGVPTDLLLRDPHVPEDVKVEVRQMHQATTPCVRR